MNNLLCDISEVCKLIESGEKLILAGDEKALSKLPSGNWIAGTIPYFMSQDGGKFDQEKIFVTILPSYIEGFKIRYYNNTNIENVYSDMGNNSVGFIIIPASSETHLNFALNTPNFKEFAYKPLLGWISGVYLNDLTTSKPKIYANLKNNIEVFEDGAVVLEMFLPENKVASIDIINIFKFSDSDTLEFEENGFSAKDVIVNGKKQSFVEYIKSNNLDIKNPLITDYYGTVVNISFQSFDDSEVKFYAPVFKGAKYRHAKSFDNYVNQFEKNIPTEANNIVFSCNCILNYLYSELEGKKTANITGPVTFGEIAYQLLNQTLVYLVIEDI
jgi:hypothetical protein